MQLNTFAAPGCYQQFQMLTDETDGGFELSTLRQDVGYLFFTTSELSKQAVNTVSRVKRRLLTHFSTYVPEVFEDLDEQVVPIQWSAEVIIAAAKQVTGLSVKDLAGIFQVTRQTLYNFRVSEDKIAERNWERLQAVSREIENISTFFTSSPGSLMKRASIDGQTLYQLLCADTLDTLRIEQLAKHVSKQLKSPTDTALHSSATIEELTRHA